MTQAANPEIDVEQLMTRIREEVARRKRQLGAVEDVALPPPQSSSPAPPTPPALGDLLRYEGADFVNNAYRAVLRREPDLDGFQHCMTGLETGAVTRSDLLKTMCDSEEGRRSAAEIKGLTVPYTLGELLGGDDSEFITRTYRTLLGREPDEQGLQAHLTALEEGSLSRSDILRTIRFSEEGRLVEAAVRDLLPPIPPPSPPMEAWETGSWAEEHPGTPLPALSLPELGDRPAETPIAFKPRYTLGELLGYRDQTFVCNAYRALLRREPDPDGLQAYLGRLRQGSLSKIDILGILRFSREGRRAGVVIDGLLMPYLLNAAYRVPLLGFLLALAGALLRPGKTIQRLRWLEANFDYLDEQSHATTRCVAGLGDVLESDRTWIADDQLRQQRALVGGIKNYSARLAEQFAWLEREFNQLKRLADAKANDAEMAGLQRDVGHLKQTKADQAGLVNIRSSLRNALEGKAEAADVDTLQLRLKQSLETRVDQQAIVELQGRIEQTQATVASKADQQAIMELQGRIEQAQATVASKADQLAIVELRGQFQLLDESKAEKSELTGLTNTLAGSLQNRASTEDLMLLQEQVKSKAEQIALTEVRDSLVQAVQAKVEQSALTEVRDSLAQAIQAKAEQSFVAGWVAEIRQIELKVQEHKRSLLDQQRRLSLLLEEARKRLPALLDQEQLAIFACEADHILDAMYVTFEDRFRGGRADIKQRVTVYLPIIEEAGVGTPEAPVVDLGCGRGEWLELLKERGFTARGVDLNRIMVNECRERGFEVVESDALRYLREQPDGSLGVVTGMHIIEHLPLNILVALFDETLRVLRPGGMAIFETPNPENLVVGACNFYMDPTHRNPLPPPMIEYLIEARGFVRVGIHRWQQGLRDPLDFLPADQAAATVVNPLVRMAKDHYFAAPDYAVVAYKA